MHKKIRNILFIIAISIIIYPLMPKAAGYMSVSPSSLSIEEGSTATFTITVFNAIGDGSIVSNNPSVATVSTGTWDTGMVGDNETRTTTVTVTGISEGSTTISVNVRDSSIFDGGTLVAQTVFVNVRKKPTVINVPPVIQLQAIILIPIQILIQTTIPTIILKLLQNKKNQRITN